LSLVTSRIEREHLTVPPIDSWKSGRAVAHKWQMNLDLSEKRSWSQAIIQGEIENLLLILEITFPL